MRLHIPVQHIGCLTNFGITLAGVIGGTLWFVAIGLAYAYSPSIPIRAVSQWALLGGAVGGLCTWIAAVCIGRHRARLEQFILITDVTGAVAFFAALFGAPLWMTIALGLAIGYPCGRALWWWFTVQMSHDGRHADG